MQILRLSADNKNVMDHNMSWSLTLNIEEQICRRTKKLR